MSNILDPDQAQQNVGPDLGPSCLQRYQQMTKVATSRKIVIGHCFLTFSNFVAH